MINDIINVPFTFKIQNLVLNISDYYFFYKHDKNEKKKNSKNEPLKLSHPHMCTLMLYLTIT